MEFKNNIFDQLEVIFWTAFQCSEMRIQYIVDYKGDYNNLRISEIAKNSYVSHATVVRFAQRLGYNGFPELKLQLTYQKQNYAGTDNTFVNDNSITGHLNDIIDSFDKTKKMIKIEEIVKVVDLLNKSEVINIFALGETNVVAQDFQLKLVRIGKNATAFSDVHTQHFCACNSNEKTLAIGITYSASTPQVLESLKNSAKYGATTLLISGYKTKVPNFVDYVLRVQANESIARVFSTTSRFTILFLLDIIYHKLIETNTEYYNEKLIDTRLKK